jgi:membrane-associated phospholipid phosphatase
MSTRTAVTPAGPARPPSSTRSSLRHRAARAISIILHPILLPLLTLEVLAYLAWGGTLSPLQTNTLVRAAELVVIAACLTGLPVATLVLAQVLRGRWSDIDVSVRRQRYLLYPVGIVCMVATALVFEALGAPRVAVRATLALASANVVNALINLKYKVSAHATTASLCATLLWVATPLRDPTVLAGPATAAALLVGWSRVALGRHTVGQVILGWAVGIASGAAAWLLPWSLAFTLHLPI